MDFIIKILFDSLSFAAPILLCTLGGLFAYKANVINIGLEGMMLFGGFIAALIIFWTENIIFGFIAMMILAVLLGLLFSFFGITKKANFIITGFAINLLAIAVGRYTLALFGSTDINVVGIVDRSTLKIDIWGIKSIPIVGDLFSGHTILTYVSFILIIVVSIVMYKTKFGTYVRVVGESEEAAKSVGIKVNFIKYMAIIVGSILCGFAGFNVAIEQLAFYTHEITAGTGFIAIAAIYCGRGKPSTAAIYAILFGLAQSLSINLALHIGSIAGLLKMIPYITIILVLSIVGFYRKKQTMYRGFIHE